MPVIQVFLFTSARVFNVNRQKFRVLSVKSKFLIVINVTIDCQNQKGNIKESYGKRRSQNCRVA
jgi:hypothetical protein